MRAFAVKAVRARYPGLPVVVPPDWRSTGSAASWLSVPLDPKRDALVVSSDILVRPELVDAVRGGTAAMTLAWDSRWRERFAGSRRDVLAGREQVIVGVDGVERCGTDMGVGAASGDFVGLARMTPAAVATVERLRDMMGRPGRRRTHVSGLFELMRQEGVAAGGVDVADEWSEVDKPADVACPVLGTKADTLSRLSRPVTTARIADQVTRTVEECEHAPEESLAAVAEAFGERRLIVRSSTTHEDAFSASNAGGFTSVLGVRIDDGLLDAVGQGAGTRH